MKQNHVVIVLSHLVILLSGSLTGCNTAMPVASDVGTVLTGQKPTKGNPPVALGLTANQTGEAFGYDFNRDGTPDWVTSGSFSVYLSQPNGTFQRVATSSFDPSGEIPWLMSAMLTDSGDLRITNNKYTPMGGSDNQNSYNFRFINGEFVLQEYTFGYGSSTRGSTFMFDLANHTYRKQDAGRCDHEPKPPCEGTQDVKMVNAPKLTLTDFGSTYGNNPDNTRFFEKYIVGGDMFLRGVPRPQQ